MASTDTIIRLVSCSFSGTAMEGAVALVGLNAEAVQRAGRNLSNIGNTSVDTVGEAVAFQVITDDEDDDLVVAAVETPARMVLTYKKGGGATGTINIGSATQTVPNGAFFVGTDDVEIDIGDNAGPTIRTALNFIGVFLSGTHTTALGTTTAALVQFA